MTAMTHSKAGLLSSVVVVVVVASSHRDLGTSPTALVTDTRPHVTREIEREVA